MFIEGWINDASVTGSASPEMYRDVTVPIDAH